MRRLLTIRTLASLVALIAGTALAMAVGAHGASTTAPAATLTAAAGAPATTNTLTKTVTQTQTVTQPVQTVTQTKTVKPPTATVTESTTVTPTVTSTTVTPTVTTATQTTPNGAAIAAGAAVGVAADKTSGSQSGESGLPTWAWVLIGIGVICAIVAAYLAGQRGKQKPGDPPTGGSTEAPVQPPPAP